VQLVHTGILEAPEHVAVVELAIRAIEELEHEHVLRRRDVAAVPELVGRQRTIGTRGGVGEIVVAPGVAGCALGDAAGAGHQREHERQHRPADPHGRSPLLELQ
jgi:hypothetical protein